MEGLLIAPPEKWISNARITQYQVALLDPKQVTFPKTASLNPATLLPTLGEDKAHHCQDFLDNLTTGHPDLIDIPIPGAELTLFTDGSSYIQEEIQKAGAAVVTLNGTLWAKALPQGTLAQWAELVALIQALCLVKGRTVNIYTVSRYAFNTIHVHGDVQKLGSTYFSRQKH